MPGFYADGEYDVAGFIVGMVDRPKVVDGSAIRAGDVLLGHGGRVRDEVRRVTRYPTPATSRCSATGGGGSTCAGCGPASGS